jgi:hypothetical protein
MHDVLIPSRCTRSAARCTSLNPASPRGDHFWHSLLAAAVAVAVAGALTGPALAQDSGATDAAPAEVPASAWRWSGYATLGYTQVNADHAKTFARDSTQDRPGPVALDSRLGLQVNGRLAPTLDLTAQAVARQRSADAPALQALEWAFLSWTPAPDWLLRLGRTSPDIFLYADVRNVGVAYPWVRPNQEFYGWMPMQSVDGLDVTRTWAAPDATWRLKLAHGQARATLVAQNSGISAPAKVHAMSTLTLSRETPEWTLKFSYLQGTLDLRKGPALAALDANLTQLAGLPVPLVAQQANALRDAVPLISPVRYYALGSQYDNGQWLFINELSWAQGRAKQGNAWRGYASLGRRIDAVTVYGLASASVLPNAPLAGPDQWLAQLTPVLGPDLAAQAAALGYGATEAANLARISQRAWGLGLRWDVRPRVALKVQAERVTADNLGAALWQSTSAGGVHATVMSLALDASF